MDPAIARRLIELNATFYERFAAEFSASRARLHPGIERVLASMAPLGALLDLGCGDARVGHAWEAGGFPGPVQYVGVDRSARLLAARPPSSVLVLAELDLSLPGWVAELRARELVPESGFSTVVCFSVLHHVPGREQRVELLRALVSLLAPDGKWALSVWQLLHLPRLRRRVMDWGEVDLHADALEPGDLLLDWQRGGRGLRYVHHYEVDELLADCAAAGLQATEQFRSDGESGDLGLYLWGRAD